MEYKILNKDYKIEKIKKNPEKKDEGIFKKIIEIIK